MTRSGPSSKWTDPEFLCTWSFSVTPGLLFHTFPLLSLLSPTTHLLKIHFVVLHNILLNFKTQKCLFRTGYEIIRGAGVHDVQRNRRENPGASSLHEQDLVIVGNVSSNIRKISRIKINSRENCCE